MTPHTAFQKDSSDAQSWQLAVFGTRPVYPGHPILLGVLIMDRYLSFAHATKREPGQQYSNAVRDSFIPGAGCAVTSALDVLRKALSDSPDALDRAFAEAERYWSGWEAQSCGNAAAGAIGRLQGERATEQFKVRLEAWKSGLIRECPYRKLDAAAA